MRRVSLQVSAENGGIADSSVRDVWPALVEASSAALAAVDPFLRPSIRRHLHSILGLLLVAASTAASAQLKLLDAENLGEAAGVVYMDDLMRETTRMACGKDFPDYIVQFDAAYFEWRRANDDEISAAAKANAGLDAHQRATLDNMGNSAAKAMLDTLRAGGELETYCTNSVLAMRNGDMAVAKRTPKASAFLKDYLAAHPRTPEETKRRDFLRGCEAQSLRKGMLLDDARFVCGCLVDVHETQLTVAERAEYDALARARKPAAELAQLPYMQRIAPDIKRCIAGQ